MLCFKTSVSRLVTSLTNQIWRRDWELRFLGPSSSYEIIILRNESRGENIRVLWEYFVILFSINTSLYFHSTLLVLWLPTLLQRGYLNDLSISRFTTHRRRTRLHTPFPHTRSEKRKIWAQNDRAAKNPTQNPSTYTVVSFQFPTNSILPVKPTLSRSLFPRFLV